MSLKQAPLYYTTSCKMVQLIFSETKKNQIEKAPSDAQKGMAPKNKAQSLSDLLCAPFSFFPLIFSL